MQTYIVWHVHCVVHDVLPALECCYLEQTEVCQGRIVICDPEKGIVSL